MSNTIHMSEVLALPVEERLRLAEEIWDSMAALPEAVILTDAQRAELDARLDAHRRNPTQCSPGPKSSSVFSGDDEVRSHPHDRRRA